MFVIKINGQPVTSFSGTRVNRVALQTSEGEAGAVRIAPDQSEVNLLIDFANPTELNLIDVEAIKRPKNVTAEMALFPPVQENEMIHAPLESEVGTVRSGLQLSSDDPTPPWAVSADPEADAEADAEVDDDGEDPDAGVQQSFPIPDPPTGE